MSVSKDFFISYNKADKKWGEWVAWHLEENGFSVEFQAWDSCFGQNFIAWMNQASINCGRTLVILSPAYFTGKFSLMEWTTALYNETLLPVRVQDFNIEGLLGPIAHIDFVGLGEKEALQTLLDGIKQERTKPLSAPSFPSHSAPLPTRFPGTLPPVWNVPYNRNRNFAGRETVLEALYDALHSGQAAALTQAISGLGGIGKTQLALEYAYRYMAGYEIVWWIRSEEPTILSWDYVQLTEKLNLPTTIASEQDALIRAVRNELGRSKDFLLIFDNAPSKESVYPYLPQGESGHVVITSRNPDWADVASPLEVQTWEREESITFLLNRTGRLDREGAGRIAGVLGDLPLALEQAAAYMTRPSQVGFDDYLERFEKKRNVLWSKERSPIMYPATVGTTWTMAMDEISSSEPVGRDLLRFLAFLAPDNIPGTILEKLPELTFENKQATFEDSIALEEGINALGQYSLISMTTGGYSVHRLVQAVTKDLISKDEQVLWATATQQVVMQSWGANLNYKRFSMYEELLPHAYTCLEMAEKMGLENEALGLLAHKVSYYLERRGTFKEALQLCQKAVAIRENVLGKNHPDTALSYESLADLYHSLDYLIEAESFFGKALAIQEVALGENHPDTVTSFFSLAKVYRTQGRFDEAESLFQKALAIRIDVLGENHSSTADSYYELAILYSRQKRYIKAEQFYLKTIAIEEEVLEKNHPNRADSYHNLAQLYYNQRRYEEAEVLLQKSLVIREDVLGDMHPRVADVYLSLGTMYNDQGHYNKAKPLYHKAIYVQENLGAEYRLDTANSYYELAGLYSKQKRYIEAEQLYLKTIAIEEDLLRKNHPNLADSYHALGLLYVDESRFIEAESFFRKALSIREEVLGNTHQRTTAVRGDLKQVINK